MQPDASQISNRLDVLVANFQTSMRLKNDPDANILFQQIQERCQPCIRKIQAKYKNLGSYVEDEAASILGRCLLRFQGGNSFEGYFRKSLCNAANTECRKRRKINAFSEDKKADLLGAENPSRFPDLDQPTSNNDDAELYACRKRWLVDQLQLKPAMKMSTLLLDQRLRCAKLVDSCVQGQVAVWVERHECWHTDDHERYLDSADSPNIAAVWSAFTEEQASSALSR